MIVISKVAVTLTALITTPEIKFYEKQHPERRGDPISLDYFFPDVITLPISKRNT